VIRLKDVDDIVLGSGLASDHLIIKHSQNHTITLVSRSECRLAQSQDFRSGRSEVNLTVVERNEMAQIIRAARARLRDTPSAERALRPSDVPGTLLNIALLSLSSSDEILRMGAYNLINELSQFFKYDLGSRVLKVSAGLSIPTNSLAYTAALSRHLATTAPQLTLEFLKEWTIGFGKADTVQKTGCLAYVGPWLGNLAVFAKPSREDSVETMKQVGEIIRSFIAITVAERRVSPDNWSGVI
jgi:neurofibromin 1